MSFDFFNSSHLAFGSKLTKAFKQIDNLYNEAERNLQDLFRIYEIYSQYINRNYRAPFPMRGDAPCRVDELFDVLNDANVLKAAYIGDDNKFHVAVNIFKRVSNRFTIATGATTRKKGYAFSTASVSNSNPYRTIQFVKNYDDGDGDFLFQYRIDEDNTINIIGNENEYVIPSDTNYITGMTLGETVKTDLTDKTSAYVASENEAILCIGYARWGDDGQHTDGSPLSKQSCLDVRINGKQIAYVTGWQCKQYIVVYLKPGDKLSGRFKKAIKVNYIRTASPSPGPGFITGELMQTPLTGDLDRYLYYGEDIKFGNPGDCIRLTCQNWRAIKNMNVENVIGASIYNLVTLFALLDSNNTRIASWSTYDDGTVVDIQSMLDIADQQGKTVDKAIIYTSTGFVTLTNFYYNLMEN